MRDERVETARIGQRAAHDERIADRTAAVAKAGRAGLLQQAVFGDLAAGASLGQRRHRQHAHPARVARAAQHEIDDRWVVDRGRSHGRGEDRRHAARRRGEGRGRDRLAVLCPRLADEGLHVDEAGSDDVAAAVENARAFRGEGRAGPEIGDAAIEGQQPATSLAAARRIDQAGVLEEERRRFRSAGFRHAREL